MIPLSLQLLGVPTPFFIGVCSSFLLNVHEVHLSEVWLVNLDTKEVCSGGVAMGTCDVHTWYYQTWSPFKLISRIMLAVKGLIN